MSFSLLSRDAQQLTLYEMCILFPKAKHLTGGFIQWLFQPHQVMAIYQMVILAQ